MHFGPPDITGIIIPLFSLLAVLYFLGLPIYVFILSRRIRRLQQKLHEQTSEQRPLRKNTPEQSSSQSSSSPESEEEAIPTAKQVTESSSVSVEAPQPTIVEQLGRWLQKNWLMKLGTLLILLGVSWFVSYAFIQNWIGPVGRISIGLTAGSGVIGFGAWWMKRRLHQGEILLLLGTGTILCTVWAARTIYHFFTPGSSLGIMFLAVLAATISSVSHRSYWGTVTGIVLASIVPLLTNSPDPDYTMLFLYLLLVVMGSIWVVTITNWRSITSVCLSIVALYSSPHWLEAPLVENTNQHPLLIIACVLSLLFFLSNTISIIRQQHKRLLPDLLAAAGTGIFLLLWILTAVPDTWQSLSLAGAMIIYALTSFAIFRITDKQASMLTYAGVSIMLLAAGTAVELSGDALVIAYAFETAALTIVSYYVANNRHISKKISLLFTIPILMSLDSFTAQSWESGVVHAHMFVLMIMMGTLTITGVFLLRVPKKEDPKNGTFGKLWLALASAYFFALIWLVSHATLARVDTATGLSLTLYTITGLTLYILAGWYHQRSIQRYGGFILGAVVVRLLLVDVWNMNLAGRIITFVLIGSLLLSSAFISKYNHE